MFVSLHGFISHHSLIRILIANLHPFDMILFVALSVCLILQTLFIYCFYQKNSSDLVLTDSN